MENWYLRWRRIGGKRNYQGGVAYYLKRHLCGHNRAAEEIIMASANGKFRIGVCLADVCTLESCGSLVSNMLTIDDRTTRQKRRQMETQSEDSDEDSDDCNHNHTVSTSSSSLQSTTTPGNEVRGEGAMVSTEGALEGKICMAS